MDPCFLLKVCLLFNSARIFTNLLDHIYLIAEPPGEPYYIARIMEFVYKPEDEPSPKHHNREGNEKDNMDSSSVKRRRITKSVRLSRKSVASKTFAENYMVRVNWFYRPKDISKKSNDSRLLFVTMNSDLCPIASIRGKCTVRHKDHISNIELYQKEPNCFWFDKLFDRYIISLFDVVPTEKIINIPPKAQKVLCERFRFAIVEAGRAKDLCAAPKNCVKCAQWCSPDDSVQCAHCLNYYHMLCVDPPLERKPSRGFGWSCAPCSGARERKLLENRGIESNRMDLKLSANPTESVPMFSSSSTLSSNPNSNPNSGDSSSGSSPPVMTRSEQLEAAFDGRSKSHKLTLEQKRQLKLWPFRYLGVHAKIEDVLDMDDRIYPRAASRLGNRHQANIPNWPGCPVVYYEPEKPEKKSRRSKSNTRREPPKVTSNLTLESGESDPKITELLRLDKKNRPPWLQERPAGYIERGSDETSTLMWDMPKTEVYTADFKDIKKDQFDMFLKDVASPIAESIGVAAYTPNFIDACLKAYMDCGYNGEAATATIKVLTRKTLKEPTLTPLEVARFEEGVRKYGSELHEVYKVVKTKKPADIVRFYYLWKKTPNGHQIWDNYEGRRHKMKPQYARSEGELVDGVADSSDDSKFDLQKAAEQHRTFTCKHCHTTKSDDWQRAPGYPVAGDADPIIALCTRCASLWRRYATVWEEPEEVMKKLTHRGGGGAKRKIEEELVKDAQAILDEHEKELEREKIRKKPKVESKVTKTKILVKEPIPAPVSRSAKRSSTLSTSSDSSLSPLSSGSSGSNISEWGDLAKPNTRIIKLDSSKSSPMQKTVVPKTAPKNSTKPLKPGVQSAQDTLVIPVKKTRKSSTTRAKPGPKSAQKSEGSSALAKENVEEPPVMLKISTLKRELDFDSSKLSDIKDVELGKEVIGMETNNSSEFKSKGTKIGKSVKSPVDSARMNISNGVKVESPQTPVKPRTKQKQLELQENASEIPNTKIALDPNMARPCAICMTADPVSEQVKCHNCGVNVHKECYGLASTTAHTKWYCDACCNDEDPKINTLYGCVLCPVREQNHDAAIFGESSARPDAVKRTFGDNWAHVKCALWISNLVFGDVDKMQPIEGIGAIPGQGSVSCKICTVKSGICVPCPHCGCNFHVSCAEKANYLFRIELEVSKDHLTPAFEFNGSRVTAKPIILCKNAPIKANMHKTFEMDQKTGKTLLQLYIQTYKRSFSMLTGAQKRASLYSFKECEQSETYKPIDEPSMINEHYPQVKKDNVLTCAECCTKSSPIWWEHGNGTSVCHVCYWKSKDEERYEKFYDTPKLSVIRPVPASLKSTRPVSSTELFRSSKYTTLSLPNTISSSSIDTAFLDSKTGKANLKAIMKPITEPENEEMNSVTRKMSLHDIIAS